MKLLLVCILLVCVLTQDYSAENATQDSNKSIELQRNQEALQFCNEKVMPAIKKAAEGGGKNLEYPNHYYGSIREELFDSVVSHLKHKGFSVSVSQRTQYELLSDPSPTYNVLIIDWK